LMESSAAAWTLRFGRPIFCVVGCNRAWKDYSDVTMARAQLFFVRYRMPRIGQNGGVASLQRLAFSARLGDQRGLNQRQDSIS
jgi:hypothetical protein